MHFKLFFINLCIDNQLIISLKLKSMSITAKLIGRLGADAEIKEGKNQFVTFSLAIDQSYKDKNNTKHSRTRWFECVFHGVKLAPYLRKGDLVEVDGVPKAKAYIAQDGNLVAVDGFIAYRVNILSSSRKTEIEAAGMDSENTLTEPIEDLPF